MRVSLVRSAGLQKFRQVVEDLGGDANAYARRAGLPDGALDTDKLLVEDTALAAALEIAAVDLGCPDLGLRVAEAQDFGMLGPLAVAIQHSASVAEALVHLPVSVRPRATSVSRWWTTPTGRAGW